MRSRPALDTLRARIAAIEADGRPRRGVLPFGVAALDACLPGGGLALGALHEVAGGAEGAVDGAAAALFAAGIVARTEGRVLWCVTRPDLFAPALGQAGLELDRVIHAEAGEERTVLACCEEGLRHGGLGAVVGEVAVLSLTASRRLQLAAEAAGTLAIMLRRWRRAREATDPGQPTAAATRWRVDGAALTPLARAGDRPAPLAARADPLPWRDMRRPRGGGLRCRGSSRSSCRAGRRTGSGAGWAAQRHRLMRRSC